MQETVTTAAGSRRSRVGLLLFLSIAAFLLALALPVQAASTPDTVKLQGRLIDAAGDPVDLVSVSAVVKYYDAVTAGTLLATETLTGVNVTDGDYKLEIGSGSFSGTYSSLSALSAAESAVWITMNFDSDGESSPRVKLLSVPFVLVTRHVAGNVIREGLNLAAATMLALDGSGVLAFDGSERVTVAANSGTLDTLASISGASTGDVITLIPDSGDTIIVDHVASPTTNQMLLAAGRDAVLDRVEQSITLCFDGTYWTEIDRNTGLAAYIRIVDEKSSGTNGGTFQKNAWRVRTLNTVKENDHSYASLSSNQITLPPGTWRWRITCPAYDVDNNRARLANTTDSTYIYGTSEYSSANAVVHSVISGMTTIAASKVFEVQHVCSFNSNTFGFGVATAVVGVNETYTIVEIWKID